MPQMKEQEKFPENEMEVSNLPDIEFKGMFIRMLKEPSENYSSMKKDTETIKKNLSEVKNTLLGINSRLDKAEDQIMIWKTR